MENSHLIVAWTKPAKQSTDRLVEDMLPLQAGCDTRSIFKQSKVSLNLKFSIS